MIFQKKPRIEIPKILAYAKGQPCTLRIHGVCNRDSDTVVAAHSPCQEDQQGMGQKPHDFLISFACSTCHAWLDGRVGS